MGYYSEVRFNTTKETYDKFKAMLNEDTKKWLFGDTGTPEVYDEYEDEVIFGWVDVKWYDGYPEVEDVMKAYRTLREDDMPFEYVRIGEDYDDYEHDREEYDWEKGPALTRHIEPMLTINVW